MFCFHTPNQQEAAILPGITKKISQTFASAFAAWMLPRTGQWAGAAGGFAITSAGLFVYGLGSLCCMDQVLLKMMNFVFKMMNFVFKMISNDEFRSNE